MKFFLAGGTGFLGRHLVYALLASGHEVILLARRTLVKEKVHESIRIVSGDPVIPGPWQKYIAGHDAVINLTGS